MRRILFCIATSLAMFSCGSDSSILDPDIDGGKELREVSFNVSVFTQTTEPLMSTRAAGTAQQTLISYFVYDGTTGAYVKQKNFIQNYAAKPELALKDTLPSGKYTVCIAIQYVQDGKAIAQPNITKKFTDATFAYTSASPCFFQSYPIDITEKGVNESKILPRVTGAAEIYIKDILKITTTDVTIGAYNIPQAFKISTLEAITTASGAKYEATFPTAYYKEGNNFYLKEYGLNSVAELPFPAVYLGAFKGAGSSALGGNYPATYYRYIHSIPTTSIYFQVKAGTYTKKIEGFQIEENILTKLSGELAANRDNITNVSVNLDWKATKEITY